jgi:glucokinase
MTAAVGIDLGGTLLKAVAVSADGALLGRTTRPVKDGTDGIAEWIARANDALVELVGSSTPASRAVGVCAPGLASRDGTSIAHLPGRLVGLEGVKWSDVLQGNPRVTVLNDAHAALVGESWIGAARGRRDVVLLTLGTGVGGAVMTDGRLLRGALGRAGHLGHMSLDAAGPRSITGMPGAVEVLVGDCTIRERTEGRFASTADLIAAHLAGDVFATGVWTKSIRALGCAIASYINLFDPEIVVVGGGIAKAGDVLFMPLRAEVEKVEWRPGGHAVPIVPANLGEWAGAMGAAREAMKDGIGGIVAE